jgi:hypothetical protein
VKAEQAARELQELLSERNQEWFVKANRSFPFFINWKKAPLADAERHYALDAALLFFRNNAPDAATGRSERSAYLSLCHKNRVGARSDQNPFLFRLFDSALAWEAGDRDSAKRLWKEMLPQQAMDAAARSAWADARGASKSAQALATIDGKLLNHATVSNEQLVKDFALVAKFSGS